MVLEDLTDTVTTIAMITTDVRLEVIVKQLSVYVFVNVMPLNVTDIAEGMMTTIDMIIDVQMVDKAEAIVLIPAVSVIEIHSDAITSLNFLY
jgi:hypothetical protein